MKDMYSRILITCQIVHVKPPLCFNRCERAIEIKLVIREGVWMFPDKYPHRVCQNVCFQDAIIILLVYLVGIGKLPLQAIFTFHRYCTNCLLLYRFSILQSVIEKLTSCISSYQLDRYPKYYIHNV